MLKKALFIAALSGAILSSGALISSAHAATTPTSSVFNLSTLNTTQQALAAEAINSFDYDWNQLRPALLKKTGKTQITIKIRDLSKWNAAGLAWPNGRIEVGSHVSDEVWFQEIVMHELGHVVDFFHLGPQGLRGKIAKIYGDAWSEMDHNFNNGFVQVFSTATIVDVHYPMSDAELIKLRQLLGGNTLLPLKTT